jgi:hypothetical protein
VLVKLFILAILVRTAFRVVFRKEDSESGHDQSSESQPLLAYRTSMIA